MVPKRGGLAERICREEWNLGVLDQSVEDIVRNGMGPIRWFPRQSPWHGLADPACYHTPDGGLVLLAEQLNHLNGRGEIWTARLAPGADLTTAEFRRWGVGSTHLSYPSPFVADGEMYLTMEACESGKLTIWRRHTGQWSPIVLMHRPAIDPTFWQDENGWWLFCTFANDGPDRNLHLFYADAVTGPWTAHPGNPVTIGEALARPAGPLFRCSDGRLIRPSQDSTRTYGGALVLNEVVCLTRTNYVERPVRRLEPTGPYGDGLHTICPIGNQTIIDSKRWAFHPIDPLRYVMAGARNYRRRMAPFKPVMFL